MTAPRLLGPVVLVACALLHASPRAAAEEGRAVVVGLLPSADAEVTEDLARGARAAFESSREAGGAAFALVVGSRATAWGSVASSAVELAFERGAAALIAPPDRRVAHLAAQVGTKGHVPVVSTSPAATVPAAGSRWVTTVVPVRPGGPDDGPPEPPSLDRGEPEVARTAAILSRALARPPRPWEVAGGLAARRIASAVARAGADPEALREVLWDLGRTSGGDAASPRDPRHAPLATVRRVCCLVARGRVLRASEAQLDPLARPSRDLRPLRPGGARGRAARDPRVGPADDGPRVGQRSGP